MYNAEELLIMLKILKEQALKSCKDTAVIDVNIDSFNFVIDEAIKALEQQPSEDCVSRQAVLDLMQLKMGGRELYKAVYDLPPVTPTKRWIPVSERLPRQEVEVLTCKERGFIEIQSLEDGYWENQHGDCTDFDDNNVIAWQPLPKPYEEK